jgi:hypothetical protein
LEVSFSQPVRWLGGIKPFDIAGIDVHRVHCGLAIIEPQRYVVAGWRAVRRACRVVVGFEGAVGAVSPVMRRRIQAVSAGSSRVNALMN